MTNSIRSLKQFLKFRLSLQAGTGHEASSPDHVHSEKNSRAKALGHLAYRTSTRSD